MLKKMGSITKEIMKRRGKKMQRGQKKGEERYRVGRGKPGRAQFRTKPARLYAAFVRLKCNRARHKGSSQIFECTKPVHKMRECQGRGKRRRKIAQRWNDFDTPVRRLKLSEKIRLIFGKGVASPQ